MGPDRIRFIAQFIASFEIFSSRFRYLHRKKVGRKRSDAPRPLFLRYSAIGQVAGKGYKRLRGIRSEDEEYEENKEGKTEEDKA
jgi:hypothetical protein